ncbi:phage tail protein I [Paracoccus litorisediminis]|uniref:phage tail protein I n=1 Tax=Paracoccus litorisediminis TaxID=2006130 RepID=UPI003732D0B4
MTDLLPNNATVTERAVSTAMARAHLIPTLAGQMWDPGDVPVAFLPWLAWALSVDEWNPDWTAAEKRAAMAASIAFHRIKGTRPAVAQFLAMLGHPAAILIEDRDLPRIGGAELELGGAWRLGPEDPSWADYWIEIPTRIRHGEADRIALRLETVIPARCRLRRISLSDQRYLLGDDQWLIGDRVALGNTYIYEGQNG